MPSVIVAALLREAHHEVGRMWNLFNCYLSGRHEFGVSCEPGAIFLRCTHCGRRSPGWTVDTKTRKPAETPRTPSVAAIATANQTASVKRRALPLSEVAAS
jgi:hypothetical protein